MAEVKISKKEKDALVEIGQIAASQAGSALSKLIGKNVNLDNTECKYTKTEEIPDMFGAKDEMIVAINMLIPTKNLNTILMLLSSETAREYCDLFTNKKPGTTKEISYEDIIVLSEIGKVCIGSYLEALSTFLDMDLTPTPPAVGYDSVHSIMEEVAVSADTVDDKATLLETDFIHNQGQIKSQFLFIPDRYSKNAIRSFKSLIFI
jgi:chemotaxis protein CheC